MNFLKETADALKSKGYSFGDIAYVRCDGTYVLPGGIKEAFDFDYDNGYGSVYINPTLVLAMHDDTWFERAEYDGSEWWRHVIPPYLGKDNWSDFDSIDVVRGCRDLEDLCVANSVEQIQEDAKLCSYSYMSRRGLTVLDCPVRDDCKNCPNGCSGCDTIVRLDIVERMSSL